MKLKEAVLEATSNRAWRLNSDVFKNIYTYKEGGLNYNNGKLIHEIAERWQDKLANHLDVNIQDLYIDSKNVMCIDPERKIVTGKVSKDELLEKDIEEIAISRAIATITVQGLHNEITPSIAVNISEKGEQLAWGDSVQICNNFTILSYDKLISNFNRNRKSSKITLEDMKRKVDEYMLETEALFEKDLKLIAIMKALPIHRREFHEFIGKIYSQVVYVNHHTINRIIKHIPMHEKQLVLNGSQLSKITVEAQIPSHSIYEWEGDYTSIWKILNFGTEVLKFQKGNDSLTVLRANRDWVKLLQDTFRISETISYLPMPRK